MTEETKYDLSYIGWAPCFHSIEKARKVQEWVDHLVEPGTDPGLGGQIESLVWRITTEYQGAVELIADQWVGVGCIGVLWKTNPDGSTRDSSQKWTYSIYLESDTFLAGIAGCYAWLMCQQAKINIGEYDARD
jgi:hypothetical protein